VFLPPDNPETIAKNEQAPTSKSVAEAQLANINVGTRPEVIAARSSSRSRPSEHGIGAKNL
jgi:hypothetical protein